MGATLSENERQAQDDFHSLNIVEFLQKLDVPRSDFSQRTEVLDNLCHFLRNHETHEKFVSGGIFPLLVKHLNDVPSYNLNDIYEEHWARCICQAVARLSDEEKYTPHMVDAGVINPLLQIVIKVEKGQTRKYVSRCLYHISESAFLRDKIKLAVPPSSLSVILSMPSNAVDGEEKEYWEELLQNTDIVRHQYKPGKSWYEKTNFLPIIQLLEDNFEIIKEEAIAQCREEAMVPWPEKFLYKEGWNVLGMYAFQNKLERPCKMCPRTNSVLEQIPGLQTALFSTLKPRCHIKPHIGYYQYSEKILRVHMGIVVPEGCVLKVNGVEHNWEEGKCIIFDDTFRHEVWNPSYDTTRIVLMLDIEFKGDVSDRNPEFYAKSAKQAEQFGTDALISRDLIDALVSYGADENSNFQQRPTKYL